LHMLDIAQNSLAAGASSVELTLAADEEKNLLSVTVADNGRGMDAELLARASDPFTTTRTTRKVGMGLALFRWSAESSGGSFSISSQPGKGTSVHASYVLSSFDRMPLGNLTETVITLIQGSPDVDFTLTVKRNGQEFLFDTREIRQTLEGVPIDAPEVLGFLSEYLNGHTAALIDGL